MCDQGYDECDAPADRSNGDGSDTVDVERTNLRGRWDTGFIASRFRLHAEHATAGG